MSTEAKIPEADLKNVNLKPTETVEKVILPSAEGKFAAANAGEISPGNRQNVRDFTSGTPRCHRPVRQYIRDFTE